MTRINTILVANRGEIACRIMRSVQAGGRRAVAVYSEADANAPHVAMADDALCIGPAAATESYLDIDAIIAAAKRLRADAIHPGYGFLSENAAFAKACDDAGLVFIGPGAAAIELMGNKAAAKRHMLHTGVPCVPGYEGDAQDDDAMLAAAAEIGLPLMVKAAAGGGGRGMRVVEDHAALVGALSLARAEARAAFGSAQLILERAIVNARHVEVQVIADQHGSIVHLGERDCSVQRRHQKVIEESPCAVVDATLRERMGEAAVLAASGIDYRGAGTVEFLLDADGNFYFLEMNTRLQVEHPVTEMVTGLDLVALQINIAEGAPLGFSQADVRFDGHAIEARLYAEDPAQDFLPQAGHIIHWRAPPATLARTDAGVASGQAVSPFYDPMLAKIVAHGASRDEARRKLIAALGETALFGVTSNRDFLIAALSHAAFADGEATTGFIAMHMDGFADAPHDASIDAAAAVIWFRHEQRSAMARSHDVSPCLANWSSDSSLHSRFEWRDAHGQRLLGVAPIGESRYRVGDETIVHVLDETHNRVVLQIDGLRQRLDYALDGDALLFVSGDCASARYVLAAADGPALDDQSDGSVRAPMHGKLTELLVGVGDDVRRGQRLAVIEAMKMQHEIAALRDGRITAVHCALESQVAADSLLIEMEVDAP